MSTDPTGDAAVAKEFVDDAKALLVEAQREAEGEQLELITPEEMATAREELGPKAGKLTVLRHAREQRRGRGRPKNARNKRTDDFARYLLGFGQHPAITMMQIQSTEPEVLIEASKQEKVHSFRRDGTANVVIERMSYSEAQSLRIRCAEALMPYLESKKPVAVDMTFNGVADLVIEGVTHSADEIGELIEGEYLPVEDDAEDAA